MSSTLTTTAIIAAAVEALTKGGYRNVAEPHPSSKGRLNAVLEDEYGLIGLSVFDTWKDLVTNWAEAQSALVQLMSLRLSRSESKSWDGYLVLLTPADVPTDGRRQLTRIRYDTTRVRKIVAVGNDMREVSDVQRALLPVLPLTIQEITPAKHVFTLFEQVLVRRGVRSQTVATLVNAFRQKRSMVQDLYDHEPNTD